MVTTRKDVVGLAAAVSTVAAAFLFRFAVAGLGAVANLSSGFLGLVIFLVAVA